MIRKSIQLHIAMQHSTSVFSPPYQPVVASERFAWAELNCPTAESKSSRSVSLGQIMSSTQWSLFWVPDCSFFFNENPLMGWSLPPPLCPLRTLSPPVFLHRWRLEREQNTSKKMPTQFKSSIQEAIKGKKDSLKNGNLAQIRRLKRIKANACPW